MKETYVDKHLIQYVFAPVQQRFICVKNISSISCCTQTHTSVTGFLFLLLALILYFSLSEHEARSPPSSLKLEWCKGRLREQRWCMHRVLIPGWQSSSSNAWTHHWEKGKKSSPHLLFNSPCNEKNLHLEMEAFCISRVKAANVNEWGENVCLCLCCVTHTHWGCSSSLCI